MDERQIFYPADFITEKFPGIQVVDILAPDNSTLRQSLLPQIRGLLAENPHDKLLTNYLNLEQELQLYESFTLCLSGQQLVAFSGLMRGHFGEAARALSRTYYAKAYRQSSLRKRSLPSLATGLMLPHQVTAAQRLGLKSVFVSMQSLSRREYFKSIFDHVNKHWMIGEWRILPGLYNTCRPIGNLKTLNDSSTCWQSIAYLEGAGFSAPLLPERLN